MDRCDECGYVYSALPREDLAPTIRKLGPRYGSLLEDGDVVLRAHPLPDVWSALEYACHMRDVLRAQRERTGRALHEDEPTFESMRREERVIEERYNEQRPADVAAQLREAAEALAADLDRLDERGWSRTGIYNWPSKEPRTVEWIARHTIHEGVHHLMDMERLIALGR